VLVGWQGGDERYPYIAGWLGSGGGGNSRLVFVADRINIGADSDSDVDKVAKWGRLYSVAPIQLMLGSAK
jgi:hypothetical protein